MWWNSSKYVSLQASGEDELKVEYETSAPRPRRRNLMLTIAPWIINFIFFLISSSLLYRASKLYTRSQTWPGPLEVHELGKSHDNLNAFLLANIPVFVGEAVTAVGARSPVTFDGDFFAKSIYRGAPNPELDAAWTNLSQRKTL